jgi:hypothetical protein
MSANNYILIKKTKGGNFTMNERDADTQAINQHFGIYPTLHEAVEVANKYMENEVIEYGIDIQL